LSRLGPARRWLAAYLHENPGQSVKALRRYADVHARFPHVPRYPEAIRGFEDLSFLFTSSQANFGLCLLAFDEAAYLYRIAKSVAAGRLVEIGRFKGGGTLLLASAMGRDAVLDSFDIHAITSVYDGRAGARSMAGTELDAELRAALQRFGVSDRVRLHVADSTRAPAEPGSCDLVFVDGDHSYDGARRDYEHWRPALRPGGHLLFHDAAETRPFSSASPDVVRLIAELERDDAGLRKVEAVGTLVHFQRV
jgi:predicted O-methyltransferase YrrM